MEKKSLPASLWQREETGKKDGRKVDARREETSGNDGGMAKASRSVLSSEPKGSCRVTRLGQDASCARPP
jgi:hypothetical protein